MFSGLFSKIYKSASLPPQECSAAFANAKMLKMAMFGDFFHKPLSMAQYTKLITAKKL
jgi:hypothetical protein